MYKFKECRQKKSQVAFLTRAERSWPSQRFCYEGLSRIEFSYQPISQHVQSSCSKTFGKSIPKTFFPERHGRSNSFPTSVFLQALLEETLHKRGCLQTARSSLRLLATRQNHWCSKLTSRTVIFFAFSKIDNRTTICAIRCFTFRLKLSLFLFYCFWMKWSLILTLQIRISKFHFHFFFTIPIHFLNYDFCIHPSLFYCKNRFSNISVHSGNLTCDSHTRCLKCFSICSKASHVKAGFQQFGCLHSRSCSWHVSIDFLDIWCWNGACSMFALHIQAFTSFPQWALVAFLRPDFPCSPSWCYLSQRASRVTSLPLENSHQVWPFCHELRGWHYSIAVASDFLFWRRK